MRNLYLSVMTIFLVTFANAQNASVSWGEEFKLKKGSTDLSVIHADNTGVYVKESHMTLKSYFVIGATMRESATLIKLDKNMNQEYSQDFNKELKGKDYERFFFLKDKLFVLASIYEKKEKKLTLFAAPVDKKNGELSGEFTEVNNWVKESKADDINFNITYNSDSTKMVIVSSIEGREKNNYEVREYDDKLKQIGKTIAISNEFDPKTFQLADVLYTENGNVVMVGRQYEYQEGKKKKSKYLDFSNYNIRVYSPDGSLVKEVNTQINGKWLVTTKVIQLPKRDIVIAAFYSNSKRGSEINGILVQRINPKTGEVIGTSSKEINTSLITKLEDDDDTDDGDDDSRKERRERKKLEKIQNEEDGFSKYMIFRNFLYTPDSGVVILAEKYHHYEYAETTTSGGGGFGGGMSSRTTWYQVYECGDLMMAKVDRAGEINWFHILPKQQREVIQSGSSSGYGGGLSFSAGNNFFDANAYNMPFYAGFGVLTGSKSATIIFNDSKRNLNTLELGQRVKKMSYFRKSECFGVDLDLVTGKYTRSILFSNDDVPTAMPRLASGLGKDLFIIGKEDRMLGRSKIAIAKLSLKN
ncbi:MAG: hypothetical protein WCH52_10580 [Bacteroidota bacterium]